jgi:hypothetical protein
MFKAKVENDNKRIALTVVTTRSWPDYEKQTIEEKLTPSGAD